MLHLVVNPVAGRGRGSAALERVVRSLERAGLALAVHHTERPRHATELVSNLPDGSVPVAVGGDGTIHEVAIACLRRGFTMGLLPMGSGDDFAFALSVDRFDVDAAVRALASGHSRAVDVGWVNGEPFVNSFGSGFDADVARRIEHAPRVYRGLGRYLFGIVTAMRDFTVREAQVWVDGEEVHAGPALLVGTQNGPRAGGSFLFSPRARTDDGLLDVVVAGRFGRAGTMAILPKVMRGTHERHPRIHTFSGREVRVLWSSAVVAHVDGEGLGDQTNEFSVCLEPGGLRVLARPEPG